MAHHTDKSRPPAILLGGSTNALSIARSLGRRGVPIVLAAWTSNSTLWTRFCTHRYPIPRGESLGQFWLQMLRTEKDKLAGGVLLPCDDEAIEFVAKNRPELSEHYILDDSIPELALDLLDKKRTLEMAQSVNVPVPGFHRAETSDDIDRIREAVEYPVIIKPILSHLFQRTFKGRKFFLASDEEELEDYLAQTVRAGLEVMVTEKIPGPDDLLGSYYTYIDADGKSLFQYTKKIIRRKPKNEGLACCHISEWDEEIAAMGRRFFEGIGFRGFGNIEFKRDPRDGQLKVIECNARFTAAQELLYAAGMDVALIVYNRLIGEPVPTIESYRDGLLFFYPMRDFGAYLELRRLGELTFWGWLKSFAFRPKVYPYFQWSDPMPAWKHLRNQLRKASGRLASSPPSPARQGALG